jgi:hypothetical protein
MLRTITTLVIVPTAIIVAALLGVFTYAASQVPYEVGYPWPFIGGMAALTAAAGAVSIVTERLEARR